MANTMPYQTDLTESQWTLIAPIVNYKSDDDLYNGGRPRTVNLRYIVDALLYQARTGCQWRLLPTDFPNHNTVRYYFDKWTWDGTWQHINTVLRQQVREVRAQRQVIEDQIDGTGDEQDVCGDDRERSSLHPRDVALGQLVRTA